MKREREPEEEEGEAAAEEGDEGGAERVVERAVEVGVVVVVDRRPSRKELAETRTRSTASFSEALLLLPLLLPSRFLFDEIEGDGRPPPLASEKKTIAFEIECGSIDLERVEF